MQYLIKNKANHYWNELTYKWVDSAKKATAYTSKAKATIESLFQNGKVIKMKKTTKTSVSYLWMLKDTKEDTYFTASHYFDCEFSKHKHQAALFQTSAQARTLLHQLRVDDHVKVVRIRR